MQIQRVDQTDQQQTVSINRQTERTSMVNLNFEIFGHGPYDHLINQTDCLNNYVDLLKALAV
jgi:hypothetical protein